jgi:hypothetical protein
MSFVTPEFDLSQKFNLYDIELNDLGETFQGLMNDIRSSTRDDRVDVKIHKFIVENCAGEEPVGTV